MIFIIDQNIPFIHGVFDSVAEVRYLPHKEINNQTIRYADALIIRTRTHCNEQLLKNTKVRFIASATAGSDHIDFDFCKKNGIEVAVAFGCNARSVAQYVGVAISFWLQKKQKKLTVGIVGYGHIGKEVEKVAKQLNLNILLNDPPLQKFTGSKKFVSLQHIVEAADIITFHTPLISDGEFPTKNLANKFFFETLKCRPLIINTARGGVLDETELLMAYKNGKIADFVVDCWENEPHISRELLHNALIATPHIAGYSTDGKATATKISVRTAAEFFNFAELKNFDVILPKIEKKCTCFKPVQTLFLENYNIALDSEKLKSNPENFEFFRNKYPERREICY